jgi:hypothetical protein
MLPLMLQVATMPLAMLLLPGTPLGRAVVLPLAVAVCWGSVHA